VGFGRYFRYGRCGREGVGACCAVGLVWVVDDVVFLELEQLSLAAMLHLSETLDHCLTEGSV